MEKAIKQLNIQIVKTQELLKKVEGILKQSQKNQKMIQKMHEPSYHLGKLVKYTKSRDNIAEKIKKQKNPVKKINLETVYKSLTRDIAKTTHDYGRSRYDLPPDEKFHRLVDSNK